MMGGRSGDRTMFNARIAGPDTGKATKGRHAE
jgi:hypothetical protein